MVFERDTLSRVVWVEVELIAKLGLGIFTKDEWLPLLLNNFDQKPYSTNGIFV